jgi:hypothetical protein
MDMTCETNSDVTNDMNSEEALENVRANAKAVTEWGDALRASDPDYDKIEPMALEYFANALFVKALAPMSQEEAVALAQGIYARLKEAAASSAVSDVATTDEKAEETH